MANKESLKMFRRNSEMLTHSIGAFSESVLRVKQVHQKKFQDLFVGSDDEGSDDNQDDWLADDRKVLGRSGGPVYSDTDSDGQEDSDDDSSSDESLALRKNEFNQKLLTSQRRFAAIFDKMTDVVEAVEHRVALSHHHNSLIPQSIQEEDFRVRTKNRIRPENYFGAQAKSSFLSRYQWVSNEQSMLDRGVEDAVNHTIFEQNTKENTHSIDFPFMPRRPDALNTFSVSTGELMNNTCDDDDVSLLFCKDFNITEDGFQQQFRSTNTVTDGSYETHSVATLDLSMAMNFHKETETTPRTKFIASCIQAKINPRASLLLRKNISTELNLQHQGMGDKMAIVLAAALADLPFVHSINLMDNNLTDVGLKPLIQSIAKLPSLTKINLSQNIADRETAIALASYVSKAPNLCHIVLHHADVDDYECSMFVAAFASNRSLTELDLSHNEIGTAELLHFVKESISTGAESIAHFLCSDNCSIRKLHLQWNKIRLVGAKSLTESLVINTSLTHLDLSYNAIGTSGGEIIGHALLTNQSLTWLNLDSNNINSSACFTICMGLMDNYTIKYLNIDNNPIGEFGLRQVLQMPLEVGTRMKISAQKCNLSRKDQKDAMFDHDHPARTYELRLEDHFHRAICLRLLRLGATNSNFTIKYCGYLKPNKKEKENASHTSKADSMNKNLSRKKSHRFMNKIKIREIKLVLSFNSDKLDHLDEDTASVLENLYKLESASGNESLAEKLFEEYDSDGNGSLDVHEIHRLITNIGLNFDRPTLERAIKAFDMDGAGTLEYDEFMQFLRAQRAEARSRIKELTENPILASSKMTTIKYIPPKVGTMHLVVNDTFSSSGREAIMSAVAHSTMMEMIAGGTESIAKILNFSIQHAKLHVREAMHIFNTMSQEIKDPALVVQKILPRLCDVKEAKQFLLSALTDVHSLHRLRKLMGSCLNPMIGLYNGYYQLDLSVAEDRICLTKLLEQSQKHREERIEASLVGRGLTGDISQKGDWSCFRNELKDGEPCQIVISMFNPMPKKGSYWFDFSGADRPARKTLPMSDQRLTNVLTNLEFVVNAQKLEILKLMQEMKQKCIDNNPGIGNFSPVIKTKQQAEEIQFFMLRFYSRNYRRHKQFKEARRKEEVKGKHGTKESKNKQKTNKNRKQKNESAENDDCDSLSSSEGEAGDSYDEDDDRPRVTTPDVRQNVSRQVIEEADEMECDDSASEGRVRAAFDSDEEGEGQLTMMDLQSEQEHLKNQSLKYLTSSNSAKHGGDAKKSLYQQYVEKLGDSYQEKGSYHRDTMKNVRGTRLLNMGREIVAREKEELNDLRQNPDKRTLNDVELAKTDFRRRRLVVMKGLSGSERFLLESQQALLEKKQQELHPRAKAIKTLSTLVDVFQRVWIRSRHLAIICKYFTDGAITRMPDFGSYRVDLVTLLFCRVVDVQNFDLVFEELNSQEIACVYCRLGILNFFNPLKVEGCYCLDISRYEERVIARTLAIMSTIEPGENWINESFRWEYFGEVIPGWELTKSWLKDENLPHRGYLYLEYYSGGCTKFGVPLFLKGCHANLIFRKSLFALSYIKEDDVIDDECNRDAEGNKVHKRIVRMSKDGKTVKTYSCGAGYIADYIDVWRESLAPRDSTSGMIARGEATTDVFKKLKYSTLNTVKDLPKFADIYFGNSMVINKKTERGMKLFQGILEKANRRENEMQLPKENIPTDASHVGKKKMDLSVNTNFAIKDGINLSTKKIKPIKSEKRKKKSKVSSLDKLLQNASIESALEIAKFEESGLQVQMATEGELKRNAQKKPLKITHSRLARSNTMVTIQDNSPALAAFKKKHGHIERDK